MPVPPTIPMHSVSANASSLVTHVGIVGGGLMGCEMALANLRQGIAVTLCEISEAARLRAEHQIRERLAADPDGARHTGKLRLTARLETLAGCRLVLESVTEKLKTKQRVLRKLEAVTAAECLLTTNTSSLTVARLSAVIAERGRIAGLHFCHPISRRALVEVVRGPETAEWAVQTLERYVQLLGKLPLIVEDGPGFVLNRVMLPYLIEALLLIDRGVPIQRLDAVARRFGMPVGPCEQIDRMGVDVVIRAGATFAEAFPKRCPPSRSLVQLFEAEQWGVKSGCGFYCYDSAGRRLGINTQRPQCSVPTDGAACPTDDGLIWRLFLPMVLEATRVLDERLVPRATDIDLALINGLGLSAEGGGLTGWLQRCGPARVLAECRRLARESDRYAVTPGLWQLAIRNGEGRSGSPLQIRAESA